MTISFEFYANVAGGMSELTISLHYAVNVSLAEFENVLPHFRLFNRRRFAATRELRNLWTKSFRVLMTATWSNSNRYRPDSVRLFVRGQSALSTDLTMRLEDDYTPVSVYTCLGGGMTKPTTSLLYAVNAR